MDLDWSQTAFPVLQLIDSDMDNIQLTATLPNLSHETIETKAGLFSELRLGDEGYTIEIGSPRLPVIRRLIEIPYGAEATIAVVSADIVETNLQDYGIQQRIVPVQEPVEKILGAKEAAPFVIDETAYTEPGFMINGLAQIGEGGYLRGHRFILLEIFPIDYSPSDGSLKLLKDIEIRIELIGSDAVKTRQMKARYADFPTRRLAERLFLNSNAYTDMNLATPPPGLLIVTNTGYAGLSIMDDYIEWKEQKGYEVTLVTTQETGSTRQQIKSYIQDAYDHWSIPPSYVLLVGDVNVIDSWVGSGGGSATTDLYYGTLEGGDYFNDIGIGRFSCSSNSNLTNMITKTLEYEQVGWTGNDTWEKWAVFMASEDNWHISEGTHNYVINNYLNPDGYTSTKLYMHTYNANTQQVINNLNAGRSLAIYSGHGWYDSWSDGPPFSQNNVRSLVNDVYPFVCSHSCLTGEYDNSECFGETWIRDDHAALAFWGASLSTYWDEDDVLEKGMFEGFFDAPSPEYDEHLTWLSGMTDYAKHYTWTHYGGGGLSKQYWECYNILGDPTVDLWTDVPQVLAVDIPSVVVVYQNSLEVTVSGYPDWAMVHVYSDAEDLEFTGYIQGGTSIVFDLGEGFSVPGTMHVSVTGHDCHPYHGTADIIAPDGPYLIHSDTEMDDAVSGNNNGRWNYGETIDLSIEIENVGLELATAVDVTITTEDLEISIIDGQEYYGDIAAGATAMIPGGFSVQASSSITEIRTVQFVMTATSGTDSWESTFNLTVLPYFTVTITPYGGPVEIPATGGIVDFNVEVFNNETTVQYMEGWTMVSLPNGNDWGPSIGPITFNFPAGGSTARDMSENVPGGAPTGEYNYRVYIGIYPDTIFDSDSFPVIKLAP
jgi:hypothetical protein